MGKSEITSSSEVSYDILIIRLHISTELGPITIHF